MATIETLKKRIEGKEKALEKANKKMERILKAQASNWENNPYYYSEDDIKWTQRDIDDAIKALAKYKADLQATEEKAASRNVTVILEFLDNWEKKTVEYFKNEYPKYQEALKGYYKKDSEYTDWYNNESWKLRQKDLEEFKKVRDQKRRERDNMEKAFRSRWSHVTQFSHGALSWEETMIKDIAEEKNRKYDFIIERTNKIVGQITDASNLYIADNGDLNGFIIGTRGVAKVNTIGAGGYNIQRFHFRCLIKPAKESK